MCILKQYCRFCADELDPTRQKDIFSLNNSQLFVTGLQYIYVGVTENDPYPKSICYPCAHKVDDLALFHLNAITAINFFNKLLCPNGSGISSDKNDCVRIKEELSLDNQVVEETVESLFTSGFECKDEESSEDLSFTNEQPTALHKEDDKVKSVKKEAKNVTTNKNCKKRSKIKSYRKKLFKCYICNKLFDRKSDCDEHWRIHVDGRPHVCKHCQKGFFYETHLLRHYKNYSTCDHCGEKFCRKATLVAHLRTNHADGAFRCDYCGNSFRYERWLFKHKLVHTGENRDVSIV